MVTFRVSNSAIRTEHPALQQENRVQRPQQHMFKVPSSTAAGVSSSSQQPNSSNRMSGKRSWQEAFSQRDSAMARETMLGLSCGERPQQKPKVPQLTIFYAGAVNVYDNVPEDMVKALMTLAASKSSNPAQSQPNNSNSNSPGFKFPVLSLKPADQLNSNHNSTGFKFPVLSSKPGHPADQPNSNQSSTGFRFPVLSSKPDQPADLPKSNHNNSSTGFKFPVLEQGRMNSFQMEEKAMAAPIPVTKVSPLPGLPQARRASIQRFLEVRKHKQAKNSSESSVKSVFDEVQDADLVRG